MLIAESKDDFCVTTPVSFHELLPEGCFYQGIRSYQWMSVHNEPLIHKIQSNKPNSTSCNI